jgi:hypothetical protein
MSEWLTYTAEDFLLFSPRTYWRMFELQNEGFGFLPLLTFVSAAVCSALRWFRAGIILSALLWIFVGWSFLWGRFAGINWAMTYVAPFFAIEGVLLLIYGIRSASIRHPRGLAAGIGYLLLLISLFLLPVLAPLAGRGWPAAEIYGIAPDPTVIATLGFVLLLRGPMLWVVLPIPILWCLLSGLTLATMGEPQAWIPFAAAALTGLAVRFPTSRIGSADSARR